MIGFTGFVKVMADNIESGNGQDIVVCHCLKHVRLNIEHF